MEVVLARIDRVFSWRLTAPADCLTVAGNGMNPKPGSAEEEAQFQGLQKQLEQHFRSVFPERCTPRTVVVIPSLSIDAEILASITGVQHYEERMLCMLMLLRLPRTKVIYVTSEPIDPWIVDYFLSFLSGVPGSHARNRLTLLSCHDASQATVTEKVLSRPRLLQRLRNAIEDPAAAHMTCFTATGLERTLAVQLGIPLYACDPSLIDLGSKSGSREIFREAGILMPAGSERLRSEADIVAALAALKQADPTLRKAVIKLEEGASGEGNAVFRFANAPEQPELTEWIRNELPLRLEFVAAKEDWQSYLVKYCRMGGIVEAWVDGDDKRSPSVQCRIDPTGNIATISTHDQVLGGPSGQVFLGSTFPADEQYRLSIQSTGEKVSAVLKKHGALGRFAIDFVSIKKHDVWQHYAIEINLRKGGTTHPFLMLQFLTDGCYDRNTGLFHTPAGEARYYYASDNLKNPDYRRLTPHDLIDIAVEHDLHFHGASQQGVVFHLIGALAQYGKLGMLCVADSHEAAYKLYQNTVAVLDREALAEP